MWFPKPALGRGARELWLEELLVPMLMLWFASFSILCHYSTVCLAFTAEADKRNLLEFKNALVKHDGLNTWHNDTDPCEDRWVGVMCDEVCSFGDDQCFSQLANQTSATKLQRVTGLSYTKLGNLESSSSFRWTVLAGPLSPALGNLSHLTILNLAGNALTGTLPSEILQLPKLEYLLLDDNQLEGTLPRQVGNLSTLKLLMLSHNLFNGSLPEDSWCQPGFKSAISLQGNYGLCGYIPTCLRNRIVSTVGTALLSSYDVDNKSYNEDISYCCNAIPPECLLEKGCGLSVPAYWTNSTFVSFNFTNFTLPDHRNDSNSIEYYWTVSTNPREPQDVSITSVDFGLINVTHGNITLAQSSQHVVDITTDSRYNVANLWLPNKDSLREGQKYYMYLFGVNSKCPNAKGLVTSRSVTVATQAPNPGTVWIMKENQDERCLSICSQKSTTTLRFSFSSFSNSFFLDDDTIVYSYEIYASKDSKLIKERTSTTYRRDSMLQTVDGLDLEPGNAYYVRVYGKNMADLESQRDSQLVQIASESDTSVAIAVGVSLGFVGLVSLTAGGITYFILRRKKLREKVRRQEKEQMKALRALMTGMSGQQFKKIEDTFEDRYMDPTAQPMAFVITDLESSTAQAAANKLAYQQVQDIHDGIVREKISNYKGYEINTEGDSFHIAFTDIVSAVLFSLDTQFGLLETHWSDAVLKLPACKQVFTNGGELSFNGPRVRMGIHWAEAGTMTFKQHPHTKHWVFGGPGFATAYELGDAASGGQVIMTDHAWQELRCRMPDAGFPIVSQLGLFELKSLDDPVWIYEIQGLLGRPLYRKFGPPRGIAEPTAMPKSVVQGLGYDIGLPLEPEHDAETFDSARRDGAECARDCLSFVRCCLSRSYSHDPLPPHVVQQLRDVIHLCAQQYCGYLAEKDMLECCFTLVFHDTLDAVRFAHTAQTYVLYSKWSVEKEDVQWPTERTPDGRLIFRGPRVAVAIQETCDYEEEAVPYVLDDDAKSWLPHLYRKEEVLYKGAGITSLYALSRVIHGGQVVLSERAWSAVAERLPMQCQAISLGRHVISEGMDAQQLMEVMPTVLVKRSFPELNTLSLVSPGFMDSPHPDHEMAIIFVKVSKPAEVIEAESEASQYSKEQRKMYIASYKYAVMLLESVVRETLEHYWNQWKDGYECKEPEPGKFTVAFRSVRYAMLWCSEVQLRLVEEPWAAEVLEWKEGALQTDAAGNKLWCGLRVRMGLAYGRPYQRKPLNTGHADYYGSLPNLAARVCGIAQPGQILVDVHEGMLAGLGVASSGVPPEPSGSCSGVVVAGENITGCSAVLKDLGMFWLKGFNGAPRVLAQVTPEPLKGREFKEPNRGTPAEGGTDLVKSRARSFDEVAVQVCCHPRLRQVRRKLKHKHTRRAKANCVPVRSFRSDSCTASSSAGVGGVALQESESDLSLSRIKLGSLFSLASSISRERSMKQQAASSAQGNEPHSSSSSVTRKVQYEGSSTEGVGMEAVDARMPSRASLADSNVTVPSSSSKDQHEGSPRPSVDAGRPPSSTCCDTTSRQHSYKNMEKPGQPASTSSCKRMGPPFNDSGPSGMAAEDTAVMPNNAGVVSHADGAPDATPVPLGCIPASLASGSPASPPAVPSSVVWVDDNGVVITFAPESLEPNQDTLDSLRRRSWQDAGVLESKGQPVSGSGSAAKHRLFKKKRCDNRELLAQAELEAQVEMEGRRLSSASTSRSMTRRQSSLASRTRRSPSTGGRSMNDRFRPSINQSSNLGASMKMPEQQASVVNGGDKGRAAGDNGAATRGGQPQPHGTRSQS